MAYTSGTASDYIDLASNFKTWITTVAGWTALNWVPGNVDTGGMQLNLRGPGAAADKRVFINIRSVFNDSNQAYAWDIRGAVDYNASFAFGSQTGESTQSLFSLWKNTINYWFYANDRRFVIVAKVNTVYVSTYAGFGLPWATPSEYPFPLYIAATDGILRPYNSTDADHTSCVDPGGPGGSSVTNFNSGKYRSQGGTWYPICNRGTGAGNDKAGLVGSSIDQPAAVLPYSTLGNIGGLNSSNISANSVFWRSASTSGIAEDGGCINRFVPTAQGERLLLPISVGNRFECGNVMALDGVYFPCGGGLTPEQTASYASRTFRAFCNVHRISANDFFMIEEN